MNYIQVNKYVQVNTSNWVSPPPHTSPPFSFFFKSLHFSHLPGSVKSLHRYTPAKVCRLICKARLSICKRDTFRRAGNKHFPLLPFPPLTGEWQLFKCKLSLTNTTLRDTCFNHGNKGAASGRAGAPAPCDIQMTGRCNAQKQQHQRMGCAGRGIRRSTGLPPTRLISLIFTVIKAGTGWKSLPRLPLELRTRFASSLFFCFVVLLVFIHSLWVPNGFW